ncbi:MAG: hypothetical protein HQM13_00675 [SAR324 cluster bacterium]|nr:hypothetical protein [SAR324 cluster bacterium]
MSNLVETLPPQVKIWFAFAVAGVITADGVVTETELEFLRETINFLESVEDINEVVGVVKAKERPVLKKLSTDPQTAALILIHLAQIAITDGKLDNSEVDFFKYVGKKLGFDGAYSEEVMEWGKENLKVEKRKKTLIKKSRQYKIY